MSPDPRLIRHVRPVTARGRIAQFPRYRPIMPGTIENHAASRAPDARTQEIRAYVAQLLATPQFAAAGRRGQLLQYLVDTPWPATPTRSQNMRSDSTSSRSLRRSIHALNPW